MTFQPEILYGVGALLLLGALIWAVLYTKHRNRANDAVTEKATHELYTHPASYDSKREELRKQLRPD